MILTLSLRTKGTQRLKMVSQGFSFTLVFLLATLITLGEANNNRKLLYTQTNYQPASPLPSPVYSPPPPPSPVYSPDPPPSPVYSPPADLPPHPTPEYSPPAYLPPPTPVNPPVALPPPQVYKAFYYRKSPPPPPSSKPWWWLL